MLEESKSNDSSMIIAQALADMKKELGDKFDLETVNLAELGRRTGLSRGKQRKLKKDGFVEKPHGNLGRKAEITVLTGYTGVIDKLLGESVVNSEVIFERISSLGYSGGKTAVKDYISEHKCLVPAEKHARFCFPRTSTLQKTLDIAYYLCPERKISFDGFVNYEGRRFGVPYWYTRHTCRIRRDMDTLYILSDDLSQQLTSHDVTWSRRDSFCKDQYVKQMPYEVPSMPVKTIIRQIEAPRHDSGFSKFNFDKED